MALPWPGTVMPKWLSHGQTLTPKLPQVENTYGSPMAKNIYGLPMAKNIYGPPMAQNSNGPSMAKSTLLHFHFNKGF